MNVAIAGGGIVGLGLALRLHANGIACRVYEAAPAFKHIGAGVTLLPHAMREITALGLENEVAANGIENRESAFYNRFGQRIFAEKRGRFADYPFPDIGIHRGSLHAVMLDAVIKRMGAEAIVNDCQIFDVDQDDSGVRLQARRLSDGTALPTIEADVVIACDGVNSLIRKKYYPDDEIVFTGINTWRGLTVRPPILDGRTYFRIGSINTGKIVIYPLADNVDGKGSQLINWIAELKNDAHTPNDWNKPGSADDFVHIFESFKFDWLDVGELIRTADSILEYPMVDKDPVDRWTYGRVTFAGDAAHPMYPRGSNGVAQGLIDTRELVDALLSNSDPQAALKAYVAVRIPATANVVRTNRSTPPDFINLKVEELVGDKPFDNLDSFISQDELRAFSEQYSRIAGFSQSAFA